MNTVVLIDTKKLAHYAKTGPIAPFLLYCFNISNLYNAPMSQTNIRNFSIIAHIDHGKSTLADRMLELTQTVDTRRMKSQFLDKLDLERERGITIKLQAVRMKYTMKILNPKSESLNNLEIRNSSLGLADSEYILNLIDTPGHVDFTYEVTRSLAACEGAVLLVDATQGIQAQTLAHAYRAVEQGLIIIPVVNKVDLPQARTDDVTNELVHTFGFSPNEVIYTSGKTGKGVDSLLEQIVLRIPPPSGDEENSLTALVFDSVYDQHRGVVAMVRVVDGTLASGTTCKLIHTQETFQVQELGHMTDRLIPSNTLSAGEVGYIATGVKNIAKVHVGDTVTDSKKDVSPLPGYKPMKPLVFASLFPIDNDEFKILREAIERLALNDAALTYEPASSKVLGFGFKCGFLGLLHVDIVKERLEKELGVEVVVTPPTVEFQNGQEQWVKASIIVPSEHIGNAITVCSNFRGALVDTQNIFENATDRIHLIFELPLLSIMTDFYDQLKSATAGYASFEYETIGFRPADVVTLSILLNSEEIDALSIQTVRPLALEQGKKMVERLKEIIPRQQFKLPIQAAINGKIIARADVPAVRKDVTAKLYGGDRTRKDKLLEKQKKGKKRLKHLGQISVPPEVFREFIKSTSS